MSDAWQEMPRTFYVLCNYRSRILRFDRIAEDSWSMSEAKSYSCGEYEYLDNVGEATARNWFASEDHTILVRLNRR